MGMNDVTQHRIYNMRMINNCIQAPRPVTKTRLCDCLSHVYNKILRSACLYPEDVEHIIVLERGLGLYNTSKKILIIEHPRRRCATDV